VIIRVFRPTIHPGMEREFESFLRDTAVPLVSQQSGLVAQQMDRPRDSSSSEYLYVTVWEDVESIRAFAGERWQEAVITPDEEPSLTTPGSGTTMHSPCPATSILPTHRDDLGRVQVG
jgi:heme-degrading monooxygenase HmoA